MEEGGRGVEAESSSAPARVLPPESSDALAEETKAELGGVEEEEDDDDEVDRDEGQEAGANAFVPSPLIPLKDQLEKDKEDESLRRWKEKLIGCVEGELNGNQSQIIFYLKEGSKYRLRLSFSVRHNIVSGLTYLNVVWKRGLKVDQSKGMLGTFAPQPDPYEHLLEEESTPSGVLARGIYSAKLKFADDDKRCYLELDHSFEIRKR